MPRIKLERFVSGKTHRTDIHAPDILNGDVLIREDGTFFVAWKETNDRSLARLDFASGTEWIRVEADCKLETLLRTESSLSRSTNLGKSGLSIDTRRAVDGKPWKSISSYSISELMKSLDVEEEAKPKKDSTVYDGISQFGLF